METELGTDREAALADMRYSFIEKAVRATGSKKHGLNARRQRARSVKTG